MSDEPAPAEEVPGEAAPAPEEAGVALTPAMLPGGLSASSYLDRRLRPLDAEHYSAAGLLPYRKGAGGIELLLTLEKPWNVLRKDYDQVSWNIVGGKRIPRQERAATITSVRTFLEAFYAVEQKPSADGLHEKLKEHFVLWYPKGRYSCIIVEVTDDEEFAALPARYAEARQAQSGEAAEFRILPSGVRKYIKQQEKIDWVSVASLLEKPPEECADLLRNVLQVEAFKKFASGEMDPATALPAPPTDEAVLPNLQPLIKGKGFKGMNKGFGKGFTPGWAKGGFGKAFPPPGKGWGKGWAPMPMGKSQGGGKGWNNPGKGWGKGKQWAPPAPPGGTPLGGSGFPLPGNKGKGGLPPPFTPSGKGFPGASGMVVMPGSGSDHEKHQRQMYGEQLYVLVQPLAPNPYLAQKITGMLLELPLNELILNILNQDELTRRVNEALQVLKDDAVIQ